MECIYTSKDRKQSAAQAERAVGIKETKLKAALIQQNLPPVYWVKESREINWLLSRFPVQSMDVSVPLDGDRARPLELITRGRYSRRQIDKEIYGFVSIGTPCLVHDATVLGSHLPTRDSGCKARWMIADGMYRDQVIFYDPRTKDTSRSKSYAAFKLRLGMNFAQALNIDLPNATKKSNPLPEDFTEKVVIQLPEVRPMGVEHPDGPPIQSMRHVTDSNLPAPVVKQSHVRSGLRGSVDHFTENNTKLQVDSETGALVNKPTTLNHINTVVLQVKETKQTNSGRVQHVGVTTEVTPLVTSEASLTDCLQVKASVKSNR